MGSERAGAGAKEEGEGGQGDEAGAEEPGLRSAGAWVYCHGATALSGDGIKRRRASSSSLLRWLRVELEKPLESAPITAACSLRAFRLFVSLSYAGRALMLRSGGDNPRGRKRLGGGMPEGARTLRQHVHDEME